MCLHTATLHKCSYYHPIQESLRQYLKQVNRPSASCIHMRQQDSKKALVPPPLIPSLGEGTCDYGMSLPCSGTILWQRQRDSTTIIKGDYPGWA